MAEELGEALSKARAAVDATGEAWESSPSRSSADANASERRNSGALDAARERAAVSSGAAADAAAGAASGDALPADAPAGGEESAGGATSSTSGAGAGAASAGGGEGGEREEVMVYDGLPLIKEAKELKEKANGFVKRKKHQEAVKLYDEALEVLKRCDDQPMLKEESDEVRSLKATLHCNSAQCMLSLELYRRAIDSATECLKLDKENTKALYRRSQAHEFLKEHKEALRDLLSLKKLGGGGIDLKELERKCEKLYESQIAENKAINECAKANEDVFQMKEKFDKVMEKYDLGDGHAAPLVAHWLCEDSDIEATIAKVAKQWEMSKKEAGHFARWIKKGLDMGVIPKPKGKPQGPAPPPPPPAAASTAEADGASAAAA